MTTTNTTTTVNTTTTPAVDTNVHFMLRKPLWSKNDFWWNGKVEDIIEVKVTKHKSFITMENGHMIRFQTCMDGVVELDLVVNGMCYALGEQSPEGNNPLVTPWEIKVNEVVKQMVTEEERLEYVSLRATAYK